MVQRKSSTKAPVKSTPKAVPVKKTKKSVQSDKKSIFLMTAIWFIAIFSIIMIASWAIGGIINANNQARLDRIEAIYANLKLDTDEFQVTHQNVFGDKRVYEWDEGRSYSSVVKYVYGDTVTNTFDKLDSKIREAGFKFVDEPYPGAMAKQYHYKSENGEYVRLTVSSKLYDDVMRNTAIMKEDFTAAVEAASKNVDAGPSNIVIKVNLDDNNE